MAGYLISLSSMKFHIKSLMELIHLERLSALAARWRTEGLIRIISAPHERVLQMGDFFAAAAGFIGGSFKQ